MQKALSILDMLSINVGDIKKGLDPQRWTTLAQQIRQFAVTFEDVEDETALTNAANRLLGILITDEIAREILTRPAAGERGSSGQRHSLDRRDPSKIIRLETIANRFYLLCSQIDEVAKTSLDEVESHDSRNRATSSSKKEPKRG
jgi:hypothetical protein